MSSQKISKNRLKVGESLKGHTTFKIGGEARYWYEPKNRTELARFLKKPVLSLPVFVIGAGSNLLVREGIINKVFIHLSAPDFTKIEVRKDKVTAGAGVKIGRLISVLSSKNIGGYEFLAGIPGTVGGALAMNAGTYGEVKDIVSEIEVLDRNGRSLRLKRRDINFSYRNSSLRPYIIVSVVLKLKTEDKASARERIKNILIKRLSAQDWQHPSAGSFFMNPDPAHPAGILIDQCRLKGLRVGGAQVSEKHANFIINVKDAKSSDVIKLMEIIKERVYNQFKIKLASEVEVVS
ncbi:MAG: UDP-N-acetylmuramate dehydrogenase [Candidatus Omnitrophota bacterium]